MEITLSVAATAMAASILTELLKLFPVLNSSELAKSLTALVVTIIAAYVTNPGGLGFNFAHFSAVLVFALVSYKVIVQPVAVSLKAKTVV